MRKFLLYSTVSSALLLLSGSVLAQRTDEEIPELESVDIVEYLGDTIPGEIQIVTDKGDTLTISDLLSQGRPIVLNMAYYECPMLCNLVLNGVNESIAQIGWNAGDEFQLLTVSINPKETYQLAASKKVSYLDRFKEITERELNADGWIFATATEENSKALSDAVGFKYNYIPETGEYAHAAATFIITADGMISRYLYGVEYPSRDMKLALLEASEGKFGSAMDKLLLFCYRYDPSSKGYVVFATNVMKIGGALTVVILVLLVGGYLYSEKKKKPNVSPV